MGMNHQLHAPTTFSSGRSQHYTMYRILSTRVRQSVRSLCERTQAASGYRIPISQSSCP